MYKINKVKVLESYHYIHNTVTLLLTANFYYFVHTHKHKKWLSIVVSCVYVFGFIYILPHIHIRMVKTRSQDDPPQMVLRSQNKLVTDIPDKPKNTTTSVPPNHIKERKPRRQEPTPCQEQVEPTPCKQPVGVPEPYIVYETSPTWHEIQVQHEQAQDQQLHAQQHYEQQQDGQNYEQNDDN